MGVEPRYTPLEPDIAHGSTEVSQIVTGRPKKIRIGGEDKQLVDESRVVLTPDGPSIGVSGGYNGTVTIYEAGRIADEEVVESVDNAFRRQTAERKRKQKRLQGKVRKGA